MLEDKKNKNEPELEEEILAEEVLEELELEGELEEIEEVSSQSNPSVEPQQEEKQQPPVVVRKEKASLVAKEEKKEAKKEAQKTEKKKAKKQNGFVAFFSSVGKKISDIFSELKNVTWPKIPEVFKRLGIVLVVTGCFLVVLMVMDLGLKQLYELLVKGLS